MVGPAGRTLSFSDPLLPVLASYCLDPLEDVVSAAHSILFSVIDKLANEARRELTQNLADQCMCYNNDM